ncbi:hypothetical protein [Amycolatopsis sp. cmx-11-12]|uniref:hypothetical protein n=1 Tax=Amycolatopsis sp. cmx-11-12 TaxID=2785795 RepID=UPI0039185D4B
MKPVALVVDLADKVLGRVVDQREAADEVLDHTSGVVDLAEQGINALLPFLLGGEAEFAGRVAQQAATVGTEDVGGQELIESGDDAVFANPEAPCGRMSFRDIPLLRCTDIVSVAATGLAVHTSAAGVAEQVGAQQVATLGLRVFYVGIAGTAGAEAVSTDVLSLQPIFQCDERFMDRLRGPDPFFDGVGAVTTRLAPLAVPHHVSGALGVS